MSNNWSASGSTGTDNGGVPGSSDNADLYTNDALTHNINLDVNANVMELNVGSFLTGADNLIQTAGFNIQAMYEDIGSLGNGSHTQTVGTNTYSSFLDVSGYSATTAIYNLESTGVIKINAPSGSHGLVVGDTGVGTFNQTGGSVTVGTSNTASSLLLGYAGNGIETGIGKGTYLLSNATGTDSLQCMGLNIMAGTVLEPSIKVRARILSTARIMEVTIPTPAAPPS